MKIAVIADIHGNAPALEAVLEDMSRFDVDLIIDLEDAFNGPIDPVRVAELLQTRPMIHIRGNGERMVISEDITERSPSANFARDRLSSDHLQWINNWPVLHCEENFLACHGSPMSDTEYLLEEITAETVCLRTLMDIQARLGSVHASLVLCAHSHIPRLVQVSNATWVMNPGSVGLPAYSLESPIPHKMEVGSPSARYAVAEQYSSGWRVLHIAVPYDYEKAASAAKSQGFPEWVTALRSGYTM